MRKRALFVDDEPFVLDGLRRALRHMRGEWDFEFATSGSEALAVLAQRPFDVVVADMRMPGMSGADLLNEVMRLHPAAIRIILSGQADRDMILRCVGSTHQFLAKPCDIQELQAALRTTTSIGPALANERVAMLVSRMERVPSVPEVYATIVRMLQDPEVGLDDVARVVARDPGTTAGVLKVVNSAFFGLRHSVANPEDAVRYLGLDMLTSLVLAVGAFAQFRDVRIEGFSLDAVWHHSMAVASAARAIARSERAEQRTLDECFTAGLLHDAGKLVLADNCPAEFSEALRITRTVGIPWHLAEERVFGADHADLAGSVFSLWGLPAGLVEAIAFHHAPARTGGRRFSPLTAVHAADVLVHQGEGEKADVVMPEPDLRYLEAAHLLHRWEAWRASVAPLAGAAV